MLNGRIIMSEAKNPFKLFWSLRRFYQLVGLQPKRNSRVCLMNWRNVFISFIIMAMFLSTTSFFLFEANSIQNMGISWYISITELLIAIIWWTLIHQISNLFRLIEAVDKSIEKSKRQYFSLFYCSFKCIYISIKT